MMIHDDVYVTFLFVTTGDFVIVIGKQVRHLVQPAPHPVVCPIVPLSHNASYATLLSVAKFSPSMCLADRRIGHGRNR